MNKVWIAVTLLDYMITDESLLIIFENKLQTTFPAQSITIHFPKSDWES